MPTNVQITISLLRLSELAGNPLPPPPRISTPLPTPLPSPAPPVHISGGSPLRSSRSGASDHSSTSLSTIDLTDRPIASTSALSHPSSSSLSIKSKGKEKGPRSKFASFVRGAAKFGEEGAGYVSGQKAVNWEKVSRVSTGDLC